MNTRMPPITESFALKKRNWYVVDGHTIYGPASHAVACGQFLTSLRAYTRIFKRGYWRGRIFFGGSMTVERDDVEILSLLEGHKLKGRASAEARALHGVVVDVDREQWAHFNAKRESDAG